MNIRNATPDDVDLLMSLVERLESELPPLPYPEDPAEFERGKVEKMVREGVALVAEDDGGGTLPALNRKGHHNRVATPRPAAKMGRLRLEIEGSLGDHFVPSH